MIDLNASLGNWPFGPLKFNTPAALVRRMDELGVREAVVASIEGLFYLDVQAANRQLHRAVNAGRYRGRLLPFSVINPAFPGWRRDLAECVETLGTAGVRLFPAYHGYEITDACAAELFAELQRRRLPVQIAPGVADPRMHHPRAMVPPARLDGLPQVLRQFRELSVCLLNAAGLTGIFADSRQLVRVGERFFLDIASVEVVAGVERLAETAGIERVVFGTNMPMLNPLSAIYKLRETNFDKKQRTLVTRDNARRFLGRT